MKSYNNLKNKVINGISFVINHSIVTVQQTSHIPDKNNLLTKLRRSTGYPIGKCQQALKLFEYDYAKAKNYLQEKAEKENWDKATKLQFRTTNHGLIGTIVTKNGQMGLMVELNCETDFVTKNTKFGHLMETVLHSVQNYVISNEFQSKQLPRQTIKVSPLPLLRYAIEAEMLKTIPIAAKDDKSHKIQDSIAQAIGSFGENIAIRRAICMQISSPPKDEVGLLGLIGSYCHAINRTQSQPENMSYGKYGALVALQTQSIGPSERPVSGGGQSSNKAAPDVHKLGQQIAQHVVGMNPEEIGDYNGNSRQGLGEGCKEDILAKPAVKIFQHNDAFRDQNLKTHDLNENRIKGENMKEECVNHPEEQHRVSKEADVTATIFSGKIDDVQSQNDEESSDYDADEFDETFYREYYENLKAEEASGNEKSLLRQDYLLEPTKKVAHVLAENGVTVLDFVRYECGEECGGAGEQNVRVTM